MSLLFSHNPYRILGVLSNSSPRVIQKNISKLKAFSKLGKSVEFDFDFPFLNLAPIDRSVATISKVENRVLLDLNKVKQSLFWFQDVSSVDSIAFANLVLGDTDKALNIWMKLIKSGKVSSKNFSAFNNTSSLLILLQLDNSKTDKFTNDNTSTTKLKQAIDYKVSLINSNFFEEYCQSLGVNSNINPGDILLYLAEKILEIIQQNFTSKQISDFTNGLNPIFSDLINSRLIKEPITNIKEQLDIANKSLESDVKQALIAGKSLIKNTVSDLRYLKDTLGENHYQYEALSDKVSNQILQCGIVYFNKMGDDQSYLSSYKYALSIAVNEKTKTRAKDCVKHCEEEKNAKVCKFCNKAEVTISNGLRVKMHKMTSFNQYSYFKNGGLELKCCSSCKSKKNTNKILAPVLATITYGLVAALTYGWLIGIDLIFARFNIAKWWFRLINKQIYFNNVKDHPLIKKSISEGYDFGMP